MQFVIVSLAVTRVFSTKIINSTAVRAMWFEVESPYLDHYTVYYYPDTAQNGRNKRQNNSKMAEFPTGRCFGTIGGLEEEQEYLFSLAVTINIYGQKHEGQRTEPVPPG